MLNQLDNIEDDILHMGNIRPNYYADGGMVANDQRSPLMASMGQNTIGLEGGIGEEGGGDYKSLAETIRQRPAKRRKKKEGERENGPRQGGD